jgi:hypothetical protein
MNLKDYAVGLVIGFIVAAIVFAPGRCEAQTTYLYGPQGQSLGTVQQFNNSQYFYGPQGQSLGTAQQFNNTTYVYGNQGQAIGTFQQFNNTPAPIPTQSLTPVYDSIFGK